jgi:pimeloyl-ACP methyl ester carboxylesterase/archaellum component FlaF (FlaF/FlaG flagellin family)
VRNVRFLLFATLAVAVLLATSAPTGATSPGTTERVSVDSAVQQGNSHSYYPAVSTDGRYVAFVSYASNLVPGDTNSSQDVFVHDRDTDADGIFDEPGAVSTARVSVDSAGNQGTDSSTWLGSISGDGRYVAFMSFASNLVPGDTNSIGDVFVHDRDTDADGIFDEPGAVSTARVNVDSAGNQAYGSSDWAIVSGDGRYVAFYSYDSNLVPGDTNEVADVFVHDRLTGIPQRVSVDSAGNQGNGESYKPAISADGRFVAFTSAASNLVPGDTNATADIFVRDRDTDADGVFDEPGAVSTARVSIDSAENQGNAGSDVPAISADGRHVAFTSAASNLAPGDSNNTLDIFVRDRQAGTTERVSVDNSGDQGSDYSGVAAMSADGRYVVFTSHATNLVPGDTNGSDDIFVRDRDTDADGIFDEPGAASTTRVSVDSAGNQGNSWSSYPPSISANGRYAAFTSGATNLVPGDTNGVYDVFVHDRCPDGSCVAPPALERAVIFIQGIDSESREGESPADCSSTTLGFIQGGDHQRAGWIADYLSDPEHVGGLSLQEDENFFYFSYSGQYCLEDGIQDFRRPIYEPGDTCDGVADAADKLQTMLAALITAHPEIEFDIVAHSMGGLVSAYWAVQHGNDPTAGGPMKSYIHSLVTFDSPLRGLPLSSPTTHCAPPLNSNQSWADMLCYDPGHSPCPIVDTIGSYPIPGPPIYTIDAIQPRLLNIQDVPSERTTLPFVDSALHCAFNDGHSPVWESATITGPPPAGCWAGFHHSDDPPPVALKTPNEDAKGAFVACAVASVSASECLDEIGTDYEPPAALPGPAPAASTELQVSSNPFAIGDSIVINPFMPNEEENEVVGFASILLASPLQFDHEAGEPVVILADSPAVGGIASLPDISNSSGPNQLVLAGAIVTAAVALTAGGLYAKRRWVR